MYSNTSAFEDNRSVFQNVNNENTRNASKRHCAQSCEIFKRNNDIAHKNDRPNHNDVCGLVKGSTKNATTGTNFTLLFHL